VRQHLKINETISKYLRIRKLFDLRKLQNSHKEHAMYLGIS